MSATMRPVTSGERHDHRDGARRIDLSLCCAPAAEQDERKREREREREPNHVFPLELDASRPPLRKGTRELLFLPCHLARFCGLLADFLPRRRRAFRRRHQATLGVFHLVLGELPALPIDVEDDAVRVPELALEAFVLRVAEIEEELAAG